MGNTKGKQSLSDTDKEYLNQHTAVTMDNIVRYENFLLEHPDGQITPQHFR